ncbi:MAG: Xaa-Pro dipeptidase [Polyangiaceae bacterium]|nr:Xaa-Pro dipeptidase [Polyangiaceae bacterium]
MDLDGLYLAHVHDLAARYAAVLERTGWDAVAIHSGSPVKRSAFDDQFWPLRPVPHWQHWVPLAEPDDLLVIRPSRRPTLVRSMTPSFWEEPPPAETDAFEEAFDVVRLHDPARAGELVGPGRVAFIGEDRIRAGGWGFASHTIAPSPLVQGLDALRVTKTPYEVACIAEANRRARAGHVALRDAFAAGDSPELDLHLLYLRATAQDDCETPYKNIVALGRHAATLHHVAYGKTAAARPAESLLVDAGATCRGYAADITRTWVKGDGATASAFAALVASLDGLQQHLSGRARPPLDYERLHDDAHPLVAAALRDAGLLRGSLEEAVEKGVTRAFFPHGLGHSLGLQTHDVGCALRAPRRENAFLRNTTPIAPGQVFTIEPGIYFIDALLDPLRQGQNAHLVDWAAVDALAPLGGARIEDDLAITGEGARNLTREQLPVGGGRV